MIIQENDHGSRHQLAQVDFKSFIVSITAEVDRKTISVMSSLLFAHQEVQKVLHSLILLAYTKTDHVIIPFMLRKRRTRSSRLLIYFYIRYTNVYFII